MPCFYPLTVYRSRKRNEKTGKFPVLFSPVDSTGQSLEISCGQCLGCKLTRSQEWAVRLMHENQLHNASSFITLTYNAEHLPEDYSLHKRDFSLFMKRLRKAFSPRKIRYFHCGEYGSKLSRPHYHGIIFGVEFDDKILYKEFRGTKLYISEQLQDLWGKGFATIGAVTPESVAYVARYVIKKMGGDKAENHYKVVDGDTGEEFPVLPEYVTMSLKPAIGSGWYEKFKSDLYPSDFAIIKGKKFKVPKYYDKLLEIREPDMLKALKRERKKKALKRQDNNTWDRLAVRHEVLQLKVKKATRDLEHD